MQEGGSLGRFTGYLFAVDFLGEPCLSLSFRFHGLNNLGMGLCRASVFARFLEPSAFAAAASFGLAYCRAGIDADSLTVALQAFSRVVSPSWRRARLHRTVPRIFVAAYVAVADVLHGFAWDRLPVPLPNVLAHPRCSLACNSFWQLTRGQ